MTTDKWQTRFLRLAKEVATWSKDPSTQVGAVIVDQNNRVVSLGFNGFARGVDDALEIMEDREAKLRRMIHAEENALLFAGRDVTDCTIYVTHAPCAPCAAKIIQAGIKKVVFPKPEGDFYSRWVVDMVTAVSMYQEVGVVVIQVETEEK